MSVKTLKDLTSINFDPYAYTGLFEGYQEDLSQYIDYCEGFKERGASSYERRYLLNLLVEKWQPVLGFSKETILDDIREKQTPKADIQVSMTLKQALNNHNPGSSWLIPNILRSVGLYILGGEPKAGKSMLLYLLLYAVCVSGEFLGRPVKKGKVLFLQLEENEYTIADRLYLAGFGDLADENTRLLVNFLEPVYIERSFDITSDLEWLKNKIKEIQPVLVIIDSLRMASLKSTASENSNEMGKLVYSLQQVFNFTNTCGVLVHHMSKLGGRNRQRTGLIERLAGHTSISSACDGIIGVQQIESEDYQDQRVIELNTLPRDGLPISIHYSITTNECGLWKLNKLFEESEVNMPTVGKILRYLADNQEQYVSTKRISEAIDIRPEDVYFKEALQYLVNSQIVLKKYLNKSFSYCIGKDSVWIANPQSLDDLIDTPAILDANKLMGCNNKRELRTLIETWEDQDRPKIALKFLRPEERDRLQQLIKSWEFDIGDTVYYKGKEYQIEKRVDSEPSLLNNRYVLDNSDVVKEIELSTTYATTEETIDFFLGSDDDQKETKEVTEDESSSITTNDFVSPEPVLGISLDFDFDGEYEQPQPLENNSVTAVSVEKDIEIMQPVAVAGNSVQEDDFDFNFD